MSQKLCFLWLLQTWKTFWLVHLTIVNKNITQEGYCDFDHLRLWILEKLLGKKPRHPQANPILDSTVTETLTYGRFCRVAQACILNRKEITAWCRDDAWQHAWSKYCWGQGRLGNQHLQISFHASTNAFTIICIAELTPTTWLEKTPWETPWPQPAILN